MNESLKFEFVVHPKNRHFSMSQTSDNEQLNNNNNFKSPKLRKKTNNKSVVITPPPNGILVRKVSQYSTSSASSATSSSGLNETPAPNNKQHTKEMWRCDYCNIAKFPTLEEAEKHEITCKIECQKTSLIASREILCKFINDDKQGREKTYSYDTILDVLDKLNEFNDCITTEILQSTLIGRDVGNLKKFEFKPIANKAKEIISIWKRKRNENDAKSAKDNHFPTSTSNHKNDTPINTYCQEEKQYDQSFSNIQQPPSKRQRKQRQQPTSTAPIFQRAKQDNSATLFTKTRQKKTEKCKPKTNKATTKPLASIFTKAPAKTIDKKNTESIEAGDSTASIKKEKHQVCTITNKTKDAEIEVEVIDISKEMVEQLAHDSLLNNKALMLEHKKVEFLMKRRKAEEQRKIKRMKNSNVTNVNASSKGASVACIFQTSVANKIEHSSSKNITPFKAMAIKGSGLENSPLDLRTPEPKPSKLLKRKKEKATFDDMYSKASVPQFPIPNHVLGEVAQDLSNEPKDCNIFSTQVHQMLLNTPKYQGGIDNVSHHLEPYNSSSSIIGFSSDKCIDYPIDPLHARFSSVMCPTPHHNHDDDEILSGDHVSPQMWTDKYVMSAIPHEIYGDDNKITAEDLLSFVKEWKDHRQQAIIAAEKAHQRRNGKKKKKKKTKKRQCDYDDDFFSDSDDEYGLPPVYVLCGPSGSGKSTLVYAAAKKCNCVVLEINTTDHRGGSSLKKTIEECTQSHSTLALLKHKTGAFVEETDLNDTDDEEDSNTSLALILIDEVDLMYEQDVGFWQALSSVAKNAKCPIILTAQMDPQTMLKSTNIIYRYAHLTLPSPMSCASKMCQVAKMENMTWKDDMESESIKEILASIARLCNCDIRKILNEMQSFNSGSIRKNMRKRAMLSNIQLTPNRDPKPIIKTVSPMRVPAYTQSIIEISGKGFLSSTHLIGTDICIEVFIGEQKSPAAKIIDDSTIIAISPPCIPPSYVDQNGYIKASSSLSLDCNYKLVTVRLSSSGGRKYTLDSPTSNTEQGLPLIIYQYEEEEKGDDEKNTQILAKGHDETTPEEILAKNLASRGIPTSEAPLSSKLGTQLKKKQKSHLHDNIADFYDAMKASDAAFISSGMNTPQLLGAVKEFNDIEQQGQSDVFMTRPTSHRERFLYTRTCGLSRGKAIFHSEISHSAASSLPSESDLVDDFDFSFCYDSGFGSSINEEDLFVQFPVSSCYDDLRNLLQSSTNKSPHHNLEPLLQSGHHLHLEMDKEHFVERSLVLVQSILTHDKLLSTNSYFNTSMDVKLSLDYAPILRNIAAIEKIADESFEKLKLTPEGADILENQSSHRRSRRKTPITRDHYFTNLINDASQDPKIVCEDLASMKLG